MHSWVRYSVAVYLGLLLAGSLVPLERWTSVRDALSNPPPEEGDFASPLSAAEMQKFRPRAHADCTSVDNAEMLAQLEAADQLTRASAPLKHDACPHWAQQRESQWATAESGGSVAGVVEGSVPEGP